jgi:hypothetical protein
VTALVRRIYGEIATRRPGVLLSAATITWGGLEMGYDKSSTMTETFQDWFRWKQEGIMDLACPMNYKRGHRNDEADDFRDWAKAAVNAPGLCSLVMGVAGWLNNAPNIIRQIEEARQAGADGVAIFSYQRPTGSAQSQETFFSMISRALFRVRIQPPETPWKKREATIFGQVRSGREGSPTCRVRLKPALSTGETREVNIDQNGYFLFARLPASRYRLDALGADGRLLARATVSVQAGQGLRRDLRIPGSQP